MSFKASIYPTFKKICILILVVVIFLQGGVLSALSPDQKKIYERGIYYYDICGGESSSPAPAETPTTSSGPVYIIGDSITEMSAGAYQDAFKAAGSEVGIDASSSRGLNQAGQSGNKLTGMEAIKKDKKELEKANSIVIALGTNGGTNSNTIKDAISALPKGKNIYWVDIISVGRTDDFNKNITAPTNKAIYDMANKEGYKVISWFNTVDPNGKPTNPSAQERDPHGFIDNSDGLGVHVTDRGSKRLAEVVADAVTEQSGTSDSSVPSNTVASSSCCPSGGSESTSVSTGTSIPDEEIPGKDNPEKIWNYLRSLGFTAEEAAGILGNVGTEGVYDPQSIEDPAGRTKDYDVFKQLTTTTQGYGLYGFTPGASLAGLVSGSTDWPAISKVKVDKNNFYLISTQTDVMYGYMKNSTGDGGSNMLKEFQKASKNPSAAAESFMNQFENPNAQYANLERRQSIAEESYRKYKDNPVGESSASSESATTACCPAGGSTETDGTNSAGNEYAFLIGKGLEDYVAAAITGNNIWESGGDQDKLTLNPSSVNEIGATGIAQWYQGRADALHAFADEQGKPWDDLGLQLDYLWHELTGAYKFALDATKAAPNIESATTIFEQKFEVSGDTGSYPTRIALAKRVQTTFGGGASASATSSSSGSCGTTSDISAYKSPYRDLQQKSPLRIDMGVDYAGKGPVYAIGKATINVVYQRNGGSGWPGWGVDGAGGWVSYTLEDGPAKGKTVYIAENCVPTVKVGDKVTSDTKICDLDGLTSAWSETGWAADKSTSQAAAHVEWAGHDSTAYYTAYGENFSDLLVKLGEKPGTKQPGAQKIGTIPKDWPVWK